jgi:hypothetical protein
MRNNLFPRSAWEHNFQPLLRRQQANDAARRRAFPRRAWERGNSRRVSATRPSHRRGGVYIAVLGTSLIVSVLALSAILLQRVQNRMLAAAADIEQARLNAQTAVDLGLLMIKQDDQWRDHHADGEWFADRATGAGTCSLEVVDPADGDLDDSARDPVILVGIGRSGNAEQRVSLTVDPVPEPLGCLRSAVAAGGSIQLSNDVLRASEKITANSVSASSSLVEGNVEAASISGSTYLGTTTQIAAADLPAMPDWDTLVSDYQSIGTEIPVASLATATTNLCLNSGFELSTTGWTGEPPESAVGTATISQSSSQKHTGTYGLRVRNRDYVQSGACYRIDSVVKPNQQYTAEIWVYNPKSYWNPFRLTLYTKGTTDGSYDAASGSEVWVGPYTWAKVSGTLTAPSWTGDLLYAFVKIAGTSSGGTDEFYTDDCDIREVSTGLYIYRKVLSPSTNPFSGGTNPRGVYWIDCGGNRITIERSRILGTLVLLNPGSGSSVGSGPIHWSPALPGYPALVVDGDFTIAATDRVLSETENQLSYNPPGTPHEQFGVDYDLFDIYPSEINGLVVVADDFSFRNSARICGQLIVGDDIDSSSGSLDIDYRPDSLLNPPPGFTTPFGCISRPGSTTKVVSP